MYSLTVRDLKGVGLGMRGPRVPVGTLRLLRVLR
jgi:hypothetical protein